MKITQRKQAETGRAYALRVLRQNIICNELAPGTLLSENELASQLGLSRVPVREALIELSHSKIIEILPQRGSRISLIDMNLVEESNFFRRTLECAIVRLACKMADADTLLELEANLKLQNFYIQNQMPEKLMELDNQFHKQLFLLCNKERCYEMMVDMGIHFDRIRSLALTAVKDLKIVSDHQEIYLSIKNNQPEQAEALMNKHLSRFQLDEKIIQKKYPEFFK